MIRAWDGDGNSTGYANVSQTGGQLVAVDRTAAMQNELIKAYDSMPKTGQFNDPNDAAKAASAAFDAISATYGLEAGAPIERGDDGKYYVGLPVAGTIDYVSVPTNAETRGIWHSHPEAVDISSLDNHQGQIRDLANALDANDIKWQALYMYTTMADGTLRRQDYTGIGSLTTPQDSLVIR